MVGPSPAEDARRDLARDREDPRLNWTQNVRAVLRIVETHPALSLPYIGWDAIRFYLTGHLGATARRAVADAETVLAGQLGVTFTGAPDTEEITPGYYYDLVAQLPGGLQIVIRAIAAEVAEETPDGRWVRLPVEPEETEGGENA